MRRRWDEYEQTAAAQAEFHCGPSPPYPAVPVGHQLSAAHDGFPSLKVAHPPPQGLALAQALHVPRGVGLDLPPPQRLEAVRAEYPPARIHPLDVHGDVGRRGGVKGAAGQDDAVRVKLGERAAHEDAIVMAVGPLFAPPRLSVFIDGPEGGVEPRARLVERDLSVGVEVTEGVRRRSSEAHTCTWRAHARSNRVRTAALVCVWRCRRRWTALHQIPSAVETARWLQWSSSTTR